MLLESSMNRKELDGLLGMYEMEKAVEVMLWLSEDKGKPFHELVVRPGDFFRLQSDGSVPDLSALIGFCHLLTEGFMVSAYPNSCFRPSAALTARMRGHHECWKGLQDPLPPDEWIERLAERIRVDYDELQKGPR